MVISDVDENVTAPSPHHHIVEAGLEVVQPLEAREQMEDAVATERRPAQLNERRAWLVCFRFSRQMGSG